MWNESCETGVSHNYASQVYVGGGRYDSPLIVTSGGTIAGGVFDSAAASGASITNYGTILGGTSFAATIYLRARGTITNAGLIEGKAAASIASSSTLAVSGKLGVTGATVVSGSASLASTALLVNTGTLTFLGTLQNAGTLEASHGQVLIDTKSAATGVLQIGTSGTLALEDGAPSGQTVDFLACHGLPELANASSFAATLSGFGGADKIDLLSTPSNPLSYAAAVLTVKEGTAIVASLQFSGDYTTSSFKLTSEGHGGSLIGFA